MVAANADNVSGPEPRDAVCVAAQIRFVQQLIDRDRWRWLAALFNLAVIALVVLVLWSAIRVHESIDDVPTFDGLGWAVDNHGLELIEPAVESGSGSGSGD